MRVFKCVCIDKDTRMELVASECSYNVACNYINSLHTSAAQISVTHIDLRYTAIHVKESNICYVYDEIKGFLMRATEDELKAWKEKR